MSKQSASKTGFPQVESRLLRSRVDNAVVRVIIDGQAHDIVFSVAGGVFVGMKGPIEAALAAWFVPLCKELGGGLREFEKFLEKTIRERHEDMLPKSDPRRLPLVLPKFGSKTEQHFRL